MKNVTPFPVAAYGPPADVIVLSCPQQLHFDSGPMTRLFADKVEHDAEEVVCRMLEDIALRLDMLQQGLMERTFALMQQPARRIGLVADQLGLTEVAGTAGHVMNCLKQNDDVALEATMARLERGFDVAVSEIWNFRDL